MSGLSGIGKSVTVLAALHRIGAQASAVRVVRSCSSRPYAHGLVGRDRLDLAKQAGPADPGPGYEVEPVGLLEAVGAGIGLAATGPRVLFVDDVEVLSPSRAAWLQQLGDAAYERDWRIVVAARRVAPGRLPDDVEVLDVEPLDERSLRLLLDTELGLPVASDVAGRLLRWSAGNPRIALELADGLSPAQQRGDTEWAGPRTVGPAARRAYRDLVDGPEADEAGADRYPLLALLREELRTTPADDAGRPAFAGSATVAEAILDGLHLDDVAGMAEVGAEPRAAARAAGVTLLTGTTWAEDGAGRWAPLVAGAEWTDHLWWRDPTGVDPTTRTAGQRAAAALVELEHTGRLADPATLRADLGLIGSRPDPHWVGLCVQVRGRLLLGDGPGARRLLEEQSGPAEGRSVAEIVARDLAGARVAMFDGRAADARAHLDRATDLRPSIQDWLPVRGLQAATTAMLDGRGPAIDLPTRSGAWSTRSLGEFAVDLGTAHLAVGHVEHAAELLTIGLERCPWPYRGRVQARADLVEAALVHDRTGDTLPRPVWGLIDPPVHPDERADADTGAAHARMRAVLAGRGAGPAGVDEWLPGALSPASPWQRLRTLIAYGRYSLMRGDRTNAEPALREARTLARLAGVPGWGQAIDACLAGHDTPDERSWDGLNEDEREIVRLALRGTTNAQIAEIAYISLRTVANRFRQIYAVLHVRDRRDLTELARTHPPVWLTEDA
ncbi:LuxR C-terminal-related transcriptional regulator [Promicromonospora sp. NPDC019610]|uniref:LuxR C-terminal-related transcriptional regulator n=1 Tax=Promicromonospora sp. NPDC019610 TaxID=3364405 RepID=UPI00379A8CE5